MKRATFLFTAMLAIVQGIGLAQGADGWIIGQTSSPVDYTPIATATIASREDVSGSRMQLSIRCRSRHAELAVAGPAISDPGEDDVVSYRINGGQPVQVASGVAVFSDGVAFKGDAVGLIRSLPSEGELAVHLGSFPLVGLEAVRAKIAVACEWPHAVAKRNN